MSRRSSRRSPSRASPSDVRPEDFEALVQLHQRYTEDVVSRASRRALTEGRRRSQRSDLSGITAFPITSRTSSMLDFSAPSVTSSPHMSFSETARFSAASTSSSHSGVSTAGDSAHAYSYLAPPGGSRLRNRSSEATIDASHGQEDSSGNSRDDPHDHSESDHHSRIRRGETVKNYVCTYCNKDFGGKSDWKRHETTFHEPQYTWQCPICNRSFNSKRKFSTHHIRDHNCGDGCDHSTEAQKALPSKTAFGCGFQSCNQVLYSWDERCNHVAKHFEDGEIKQNWLYSTMMKNLLRQEQLDGPWKRLLTEAHGRREYWPYFVWRQEDTRDLRERLEYGDFGDVQDLLQRVHQAGLTNATSRPDVPNVPSPALQSTGGSLVVNPFGDNEALARQSQLQAMGVAPGAVSPGHPALGAEMYSGHMSDMHYYHQTQTVTPPSDVVAAPAYHGLTQNPQGQMYQQLPYPTHVGFQNQYQLEHPSPYPPVPTNSILASDTFYSPRPIAQTQRPALPRQTQSGPPVPPTPPQQERRRSGSSRRSSGKRMFGLSSSSRASISRSSTRSRSEQPLDSPGESFDSAYLPSGYHPDTFF